MTLPPVSVVVVSRARPDALARCLTGLLQLDYASLEIVVVADPDGVAAVEPFDPSIKRVLFDRANVAQARNEGIAVAGGEIVAFIDDDAVPEPSWLRHLVAPIAAGAAEAAGGYVLGRNGISLQWGAQTVDSSGRSTDYEVTGVAPVVPELAPELAVRTQGTNMAFRRHALAALGGFDPAFRFYLDETDLNLRWAAAGHRTAIVPLAQVHHGFAAGLYRTAERRPTDLHELGASMAVFLAKHGGPTEAWAAVQADERRRLIGHLIRGTAEPRDIRRLWASLETGWATGRGRQHSRYPSFEARPPFQPVARRGPTGQVVLSGRFWQRRRRRRAAAKAVAEGQVVTLFLFDPTTRYHRVRFTAAGVWEHSGGLFGRSKRTAPIFQLFRFRARVDAELERIAPVRTICL